MLRLRRQRSARRELLATGALLTACSGDDGEAQRG
jgi:hypothetical protein